MVMNRLTLIYVLTAVVGLVVGCQTPTTGWDLTFDQKLPAPRETPGAFEKQFRKDTGETDLTRRAEVYRAMEIKGKAIDRLRLRFDLSVWPEPLKSTARLWVAVGGTNVITIDGPLRLTFSQSGTGVSTLLENKVSVDGVDLMGCDFAVKDGEVTVAIDNRGHAHPVKYSLHAIVYAPRKLNPYYFPQAPELDLPEDGSEWSFPDAAGGAGKIHFLWNDAGTRDGQITQYEIECWNRDKDNEPVFTHSITNGTECEESLIPGKYSWQVRTQDDGRWSQWSKTRTFVIKATEK